MYVGGQASEEKERRNEEKDRERKERKGEEKERRMKRNTRGLFCLYIGSIRKGGRRLFVDAFVQPSLLV
jgi:hypothetical protein